MALFHGMVCDGGLVSYIALPCPGGSGLCTSYERVHFFLVFLDPQTKLPACLSNVRAGAVLARDTIDQFGLLLISRSRAPSSCKQSRRDQETLSLGNTFSVV